MSASAPALSSRTREHVEEPAVEAEPEVELVIDPNAPDVIAQPQNPTKIDVAAAAEKADDVIVAMRRAKLRGQKVTVRRDRDA